MLKAGLTGLGYPEFQLALKILLTSGFSLFNAGGIIL